MSPQYGELRPLAAEIGLPVWGTPRNFNRFRVLAALLYGSQVVSVRQPDFAALNTYVRQGDHHVGHWPTFLVLCFLIINGVNETLLITGILMALGSGM